MNLFRGDGHSLGRFHLAFVCAEPIDFEAFVEDAETQRPDRQPIAGQEV